MFNVIDHATGWKIDFILRKNRSFSEQNSIAQNGNSPRHQSTAALMMGSRL
jgi:hypothetical protein